jgi:chromosome segregation ATPase
LWLIQKHTCEKLLTAIRRIFNSFKLTVSHMSQELSLSLVEIIVLMLGAITLGVTIHFFFTSRKSLREATTEMSGKTGKELGEWKSKYFNETELRDKELIALRQQLADAEENNNIYAIEAEETKKLNKKLKEDLEQLRTANPIKEGVAKSGSYTEQLTQAQTNLIEHSKKINELLGQIDIVKETEEKQKEILKYNEELSNEIDELRSRLTLKEKEVNTIRQKENLTKEMSSMLDNAYTEFNVLQERIKKLESQVANSKKTSLEFEDVKESHYRLNREFEEQKLKYTAAAAENRELKELLADAEDELKEANFQRQQLQKRVAFLEDMNSDMLEVTDTNKKLEGQLKRIGELESMLNIMAEEREQLEGHRTQQHLKTG